MAEPSHELTFRVGAALPADHPTSQFVVSVGAALNDLLYLLRLFVDDEEWGLLRRPPSPEEAGWIQRQITSALFEFGILLEQGGKDTKVTQLLAGLSSDGKAELAQVDEFRKRAAAMKGVRNGTHHYLAPGDAKLIDAMEEVASETSWYRIHPESVAGMRAVFADLASADSAARNRRCGPPGSD